MKTSSFTRKSAPASQDIGVKPGLHGQPCVSTGQPDLDRLLGGGLPLGSLLLVLEDEWSPHHKTLSRYFLAEGAACKHALCLATFNDSQQPISLSEFLPLRVEDSASGKPSSESSSNATNTEEYKLRIAWQYQRYSQQGSSSAFSRTAGKDWCHQYDLTKPSSNAQLEGVNSRIINLAAAGSGTNNKQEMKSSCSVTRNLLQETSEFVTSLLPSKQSDKEGSVAAAQKQQRKIGRLAVLSLGSPPWSLSSNNNDDSKTYSDQVLQTLIRIKAVVRDTGCVALVTIPAALHSQSNIMRMQHIADTVIQLQTIHDESDVARLAPDSASVAGLLCLLKLPSIGSVAGTVPAAPLHLIRHKRKRIVITPVEIDPDAEAALHSGSGNVPVDPKGLKPVAGGGSKGSSSLDF